MSAAGGNDLMACRSCVERQQPATPNPGLPPLRAGGSASLRWEPPCLLPLFCEWQPPGQMEGRQPEGCQRQTRIPFFVRLGGLRGFTSTYTKDDKHHVHLQKNIVTTQLLQPHSFVRPGLGICGFPCLGINHQISAPVRASKGHFLRPLHPDPHEMYLSWNLIIGS